MVAFICAAVPLISCETIHCDFHSVLWVIAERQYSCPFATITSDENLTHAINVTGNHTSGRSNTDVKAFTIYTDHEHLNRIPKGLGNFFPNLILFLWNYGSLTTLAADDLKPFPELQVFYAKNNKLVSIDGDLFMHSPNLILVDLQSNLLDHVGFGLLDGLNNLTSANFENNSCISVNAETPATIQELKLQLQNQCPALATTTTSSSHSISLAPTTISTSAIV